VSWYQAKELAGAGGVAACYFMVRMASRGRRRSTTRNVVRFLLFVGIGTLWVHFTCRSAAHSDWFFMGVLWPYFFIGLFGGPTMSDFVDGPSDDDLALADSLGLQW